MRHTTQVSLGFLLLAYLALFSLDACAQDAKQGPTDNEIRDILMRASVAVYEGACPCPESPNAKGDRCGATSAYSKEQGAHRLLCATKDVTAAMIKRYRDQLPKP